MNIYKLVVSGFSVLKVGYEFKNPAAWKNAQTISSLLFALIGVLAAFNITIDVMPDDVIGAATVLAGLANAFITTGSSKKVGVKSRKTEPVIEESTEEPDQQDETPLPEELPPIELVGHSEYNDKTLAPVVVERVRVLPSVEPERSGTDNQEPQTSSFGDKY